MVQPYQYYKYASLQDAKSQIRVLSIDPGADEDLIRCSLEPIRLEKNSHACLSYCWGEDVASLTILINGYRFCVRQNLHNFLHYARHLGYRKRIWIDALCIDQENAVEKSVQVELMREIYSLASETLVWLGVSQKPLETIRQLVLNFDITVFQKITTDDEPELPLTKDIISLKKRIYTKVDAPELDIYWLDVLNHFRKIMDQHASTSYQVFVAMSALKEVIKSPYWTRVWILQELVLSGDTQLLIGMERLSVTTLFTMTSMVDTIAFACRLLVDRNAMKYMEKYLDPSESATKALRECWDLVEAYSTYHKSVSSSHFEAVRIICTQRHSHDGINMLSIIANTRGRGCADPRDRIYAVQALLDPVNRVDVDYNKCSVGVFADVIQKSLYLKQQYPMTFARCVFDVLEIDLPQHDPPIDTQELLRTWIVRDVLIRYTWARYNEQSGQLDLRSSDSASLGLYLRVTNPLSGSALLLEFLVSRKTHDPTRGYIVHVEVEDRRVWKLEGEQWTQRELYIKAG